MKTKILSVLLACLMVFSVLPVAAFAEEAVAPACTIVGDADHTLKNCPDAKKIEVVPTVCDKWGYTLYQCPACSDYFADDFVPAKDEHSYVVTTPAVEATCQNRGQTAIETCEKCGAVKPGSGAPIPFAEHVWEVVEGGNCVIGGYKVCTVCNTKEAIGQTGEGHKWNKVPEIVKAPSCEKIDGVIVYENGVAKYTCSVCGDTKNVTIIAAHMQEAMEHVEYKAPTCTEDGNIEYWVCLGCGDENKACGAIFVADPNKAGALVEATKDENGEYITVIPAHGHDFTNQAAHDVPAPVAPTCTEDGSEVRTCNICNEDVTIVLPALGHTADLQGPPYDVKEPTCDRYGYKIWICLVCGEHAKTETIPMNGHTKPVSYAGANCLEKGTYDCTVCGETQTEEATGHALTTVTVPFNCVTFTYTYTYCTNENCPLPLVATVVVEGVEYDVTIPGETVADRLSVHLVGEIVVDTSSGLDTAPDHVYRQTDKELYSAPTCTENGRYVYYCRYCRQYAYENYGEGTEPALGHNMVIDTTVGVDGVVAPTCTDYGYTAWKCTRCDHTEERSIEDALGHDYDDGQIVYPTCTTPGYTVYTCEVCGHVMNDNWTTFVPEVEALFYIAHQDPSRVISVTHPLAHKVGDDYIKGTCEKRGLYNYFCPDCGEFLLVVQENTGEGHKMPEDIVIEPADCVNPGKVPAYVCTACGEPVAEKEIPALGHKPGAEATCTTAQVCANGCGYEYAPALGHNLINVDKLNPTCTEKGYTAHKLCTVCGYTEGKKELDALDHKRLGKPASKDQIVVSCEAFGLVHYLCPDCKGDANGDFVFGDLEAEYIVNYRPALGHNFQVSPDVSEGGLSKAMDCENDGQIVEVCANGDKCHYTDGEGKPLGVKVTVIPATGHTNAAGETIVNDCLDTVVDRVCVNEHCNITPDEEGKRIVGKAHNDVFKVWVDATCVQYGYYLEVCKNCQANWVDNASIVPEFGPHKWDRDTETDYWEVVTPATFTTPGLDKRVCPDCGFEETRATTKPGIEFSLEMDNAVVSGAGYADSSLVAVKVIMNSEKIDVWGVRLNVEYDPSIVKFESYEILSSTFTVNQAAHDNGGYVTLVANTANTEDKKAQDLPVEGTEVFAILYFRIDNRTATEATFGFVNDAANDKVCEAIKADGSTIDTNVDADLTEDEIAKADETIDIEKFLDANADGDVTLEDALALYNLAKASGYDVVVDTDKDGDITLADLMNLYEYLVGSKLYADMTALRA
ncbi:MAG: hypothetical protein IJW49_09615 [Clostridia bacterium]|nr:hypothetical protein [Clostridia bacterium]